MRPLTGLFRILRLFGGEILLSLLLGIAAITAGIGLLGTSAYIIASAALHPSIAVLQVAIVGVRFFGISRGIFRYLERVISHSVNLKVVSRLREDFFRRIEPGAPANMMTRQGGDVLQRVMGDLQILENFYVRVISPVIVALVIITGASFFLGSYAWELGLILFAGMVITGFLLPYFALLLSRNTSERLVQANADASAKMVEVLQALEEIQSTNTQQQFFPRLLQSFDQAGRQQNHLTQLGGINSGMALLLINLILLAVLWVAIPLVNDGLVSGVALAVITLVVLASVEAVNPLNAAAQNYNLSRSAAQRLFSIDASVNDYASVPQISELSSVAQIQVEAVTFAFQNNEEPVLKDVSFTLQPGKKIGIVGASGAGKTSIINLLLAFQRPTMGVIRLDGLDYQNVDPDALRSQFSVLPQRVQLFNEDVRQNLLLAKPGASDEELLSVLVQCGLSSWLEGLPDRLDTWIGERGVKMSGGERQRLALARLMLQDRPYILLDEPTANLDTITATEVMERVFDAAKSKGLLMISHDLRWGKKMDEILLIDDGVIIEKGGFSELLKKTGRFTRLYQLEKDRLLEV